MLIIVGAAGMRLRPGYTWNHHQVVDARIARGIDLLVATHVTISHCTSSSNQTITIGAIVACRLETNDVPPF